MQAWSISPSLLIHSGVIPVLITSVELLDSLVVVVESVVLVYSVVARVVVIGDVVGSISELWPESDIAESVEVVAIEIGGSLQTTSRHVQMSKDER